MRAALAFRRMAFRRVEQRYHQAINIRQEGISQKKTRLSKLRDLVSQPDQALFPGAENYRLEKGIQRAQVRMESVPKPVHQSENRASTLKASA